MTYAVIRTGGKQYRVTPDAVLTVEKLEAEPGSTVTFHDVLLLGGEAGLTVGAPTVAGAAVQAEVIAQIKGEKVIHYVKRRRKHSSQRTKGHRQQLTLLRVTEVLASGAESTGVKAATGTAAARLAAHEAPGAAKAEAPAEKPKRARKSAAAEA